MTIVESSEKLSALLDKLARADFLMDIITTDPETHPACSNISLIFFRFITTCDDWVVPVQHNEAICISEEGLTLIRNKLASSRGMKLVVDKKRAIQLLGSDYKFVDLGIVEFMATAKHVIEPKPTNSHVFVHTHFSERDAINTAIPIYKHAAQFKQLADTIKKPSRETLSDSGFMFMNNTMSTIFSILESNGIYVNPDIFVDMFGIDQRKHIRNGYVKSQYNLLTATGRPSNRFGGVNYAALKKDTGERSAFISRYGDDGMLVMMDYNAFHPRLIAQLANYAIPPSVNPYVMLAKAYFNKDESALNEEDMIVAKTFTFQQIYNKIDSRWVNVPYFKKVQSYIDHRWKFFTENGYVETPMFSRKLRACHIEDPTPNKVLNYMLQAYETEMAASTLGKIISYLSGKQTLPILYTYDSILFDAHKADKKSTIVDLKNIMEEAKLPVKVYVGKSYDTLQKIDLR